MKSAQRQIAKNLKWLADRSFHTYNEQAWLPMRVRRFFYNKAFTLLAFWACVTESKNDKR